MISSLYASLKGTYPEAPQLTETLIEKLYVKIYRELVEEYDAVDNGISAFPPDLTPKYRVGASSVFSRVNNLNAEWNAPEEMAEETLARFMKAVNICGETFTDIFVHYWTSWLPARDIVVEALRNRCHLHPSGRIISLSRSCPWKEHLYEIETELGLEGDIVYCLYSDVLHGKTMIQSVPIHSTSFQSRFALPDPWRGLRDEKLDSILGFEGAVFTHASGFIGGHANMEGALRMAERALQFHRLI